MKKIYIVEDDKKLKSELSLFLSNYGFECYHSHDFKGIVQDILESRVDLVLLDINLPFFDGYYVCRELRKSTDVPIIVVTSRNTDMDELMSMNIGADDFVTKPYNTQILLARINAVLKRVDNVATSDIIDVAGISLNISQSLVSYKDKSVELTKNENKILIVLLRHAGKIVSRDELMNELWQSDEFIDDNTLTVNINRVRRKLETLGAVDKIRTKRGQGYII